MLFFFWGGGAKSLLVFYYIWERKLDSGGPSQSLTAKLMAGCKRTCFIQLYYTPAIKLGDETL